MDDQMSEHKRVIDQYLTELQNSTIIKQNTSKEEHSAHVRRLQKLQSKVLKVKGRLDRLRKHRDPNFVNSQIDAELVLSEDARSHKFGQTMGSNHPQINTEK